MTPDTQDTYTLVDDVRFTATFEQVLSALHMQADDVFAGEVQRLLEEGRPLARPKGIYREACVEHLDGTEVVHIGGVLFRSRVLAVNLKAVDRVFPFIATCGVEMEAWSRRLDDPMEQYWANTIKEVALGQAIQAVGDHLVATHRPGLRAVMNPGSLADWPISQQRPLFDLFGDGPDTIGVELSETFLMAPIKSVSGVWFETDEGYVNCQLCPRETCPNRRAPYDPHLLAERYSPCAGPDSA